MGHYVDQHWHPIDAPGVPKRDKAGGHFRAFVPDFLMQGRRGAPLLVDDDVSHKAAVVERKILQLGRLQGATQLESIARWLMRSEAVASSKIEGIAPRVDKIALAELAQSEDVRGFKPNAAAVARNLTVLRSVEEQFEALGPITVDMLERLQEQLIGDERRISVGVREQQNWIGGGDFTPIGAEFVPPPPEYVPELMKDLVEYLNSATHGALLQAGIVHAQFETIHPFADGNGRVGRALIHGVLQRRGLTPKTLLPISLVLGTWSQRYVEGLTMFREGDLSGWLDLFVEAADVAVDQAEQLSNELSAMEKQWAEQVDAARKASGKVRELRRDSLVMRLLEALPEHPVVTVATVNRIYGKAPASARQALDFLEEAGILRSKSVGPQGQRGYYADDVLDLITYADRRLASSQFDTRLAEPQGRGAPARPE